MTQTVVVTGAAGALGKVVAATLAKAGWDVIGVDKAEVAADGLTLALGGVSLTEPAEVAQAVEAIRARAPKIAGLVNIAGGFRWETITDGDVATWDLMYQLNVKTALVATRALLPLLEAPAAIVNVGANASTKADMGMGAYAASKAGVSRLTEALAQELKDSRVRVNAVLPSIIDTPANRADMPDAEFDRWVTPEQLAGVIAFLLSDAASAITGALLPVVGRV